MRKIEEVLRLKHACSLSNREIARSCSTARSTVGGYLMRARAAGLSRPEASELSDTELEARLFPTEHLPNSVHRPPPDCEYIYQELGQYRNVKVTLTQLWLEYKVTSGVEIGGHMCQGTECQISNVGRVRILLCRVAPR